MNQLDDGVDDELLNYSQKTKIGRLYWQFIQGSCLDLPDKKFSAFDMAIIMQGTGLIKIYTPTPKDPFYYFTWHPGKQMKKRKLVAHVLNYLGRIKIILEHDQITSKIKGAA